MNAIRNNKTIPAITFSILFLASSAAVLSAQASEYWTHETTSMRIPTSAVIKVTYLMSHCNISITLPKPGCIVHVYFLFVIPFPDFGSKTHPIPGISSVTVTVVADPFAAASASVGGPLHSFPFASVYSANAILKPQNKYIPKITMLIIFLFMVSKIIWL